ncbi:MAG: cobalamin-dependent protein [Spirochaetales bacterium]|nr:cobalamin-dependent protein [Spirochaetales bacterium]
MKILLVRPCPPKYTIGLKNLMICEPLELEYIAAGLHGHTVEILDMIFEKNLSGTIKKFRPDILGTSSYITGVPLVKEICRRAKKIDPGIITIAGGVHATLLPGDFKDPSIDIIAIGEGVRLIRQIIHNLETNIPLEAIPNLALHKGENLHFTESRKLEVDVEHLPFPRRDLLQKYHKRYYYLFHQPVALLKTTFGCPFRCNFCFCWELTDGRVYTRSPESIIDEISQIKVKDIYIVDDTFFIDPRHLMRVHDLIVEKGIKKDYLTYCHAGFIVHHPEIIRAWAHIGLKACILGLESPVDSELKKYDKKASVDINTRALEIMRRNNIDIYGSFIVDPRWDKKDFKRLRDYIEKTKLYFVVIQPLTPLPGTKIYESYEKNLIIRRSDFELWDMQHTLLPTKLPLKEFYRQIRRIYIAILLNPFRTSKLHLRTVPSIFTKQYIRLLFGGIRVLFALRNAHKHSRLLNRRKKRKGIL